MSASSNDILRHESAPHGDRCLRAASTASDLIQRQRASESLALFDEERERIAQDLHDETVGELTGLGLMAGTLADELVLQENSCADLAVEITQRIKRAVAELRTVIYGLMPLEISAGGLLAALQALAHRLDGQLGSRCSFVCRQALEVADDRTANALYRIAQEAVNNAMKHAGARRIEITLSASSHNIRLQIRDDGRGFDAVSSAGDGMGLRIMRCRAGLIGADVAIQSLPRGGSLITCTLERGKST